MNYKQLFAAFLMIIGLQVSTPATGMEVDPTQIIDISDAALAAAEREVQRAEAERLEQLPISANRVPAKADENNPQLKSYIAIKKMLDGFVDRAHEALERIKKAREERSKNSTVVHASAAFGGKTPAKKTDKQANGGGSSSGEENRAASPNSLESSQDEVAQIEDTTLDAPQEQLQSIESQVASAAQTSKREKQKQENPGSRKEAKKKLVSRVFEKPRGLVYPKNPKAAKGSVHPYHPNSVGEQLAQDPEIKKRTLAIAGHKTVDKEKQEMTGKKLVNRERKLLEKKLEEEQAVQASTQDRIVSVPTQASEDSAPQSRLIPQPQSANVIQTQEEAQKADSQRFSYETKQMPKAQRATLVNNPASQKSLRKNRSEELISTRGLPVPGNVRKGKDVIAGPNESVDASAYEMSAEDRKAHKEKTLALASGSKSSGTKPVLENKKARLQPKSSDFDNYLAEQKAAQEAKEAQKDFNAKRAASRESAIQENKEKRLQEKRNLLNLPTHQSKEKKSKLRLDDAMNGQQVNPQPTMPKRESDNSELQEYSDLLNRTGENDPGFGRLAKQQKAAQRVAELPSATTEGVKKIESGQAVRANNRPQGSRLGGILSGLRNWWNKKPEAKDPYANYESDALDALSKYDENASDENEQELTDVLEQQINESNKEENSTQPNKKPASPWSGYIPGNNGYKNIEKQVLEQAQQNKVKKDGKEVVKKLYQIGNNINKSADLLDRALQDETDFLQDNANELTVDIPAVKE